jgi:TolB protein
VWSPDGSLLAFSSDRAGNEDVYVIRADGTVLANVSADPGGDSSPAWSPDGKYIAFVSDRSGSRDIYTARPDGTGLIRVTAEDDGAEESPVWRPAA